jgi:hypothetical protein
MFYIGQGGRGHMRPTADPFGVGGQEPQPDHLRRPGGEGGGADDMFM